MASTRDIPRYEILEVLGEGALATVYKVRTLKDGSIRALKALKPEQAATPRALSRFEDEYRILSALHHPTLPEVYDYGAAPDGTRFMVMEHLEGVPLDRYVRENAGDLWLLLYQMNEALAFIHEHGLLHFDLKPTNVLVRRTTALGDEELPLAVLIDFGLSYRRETGGKVKLVGTPGYMAPEVIRGEEDLTRAVDYYSLGVIIYELIEGQLPFRGSMHDILRSHLTSEVTFERRKVEYAELYPWVEKLMSKAPRDRLEAFQEFRRAMAARLGDTTERIERVFALGYIESLGLVGKEDVWNELTAWASRLGEALVSRRKIVERPRRGAQAGAPAGAAPSDVLKGSVSDLEERIKRDLLSSAAAARASERREEPIREISRILAITGPPESGKSHVLSALKTELHVRGVGVVSLGNESDYDALVRRGGAGVGVGVAVETGGVKGRGAESPSATGPAAGKPTAEGATVGRIPARKRARSEHVDPGSFVIDRFVAVWDEVSRMGRDAGVVVVVDDLERTSAEEKEFIKYIGKRVGHELAEGKEPGVFVIAVGRGADVKKALLPVAGKEGALSALEVPPSGKEDAEAIAERFRGHLSGAKEEKSLSTFLQANLQSSAALYASLKQAIADGCLVHQQGRWRFHDRMARPLRRADTTAAYYQGLFQEFKGVTRELIATLACHPSALSTDELSSVSGLTASEIDEAIETVRPFRIIVVAETQQGRRIDIISDQVRGGLQLALEKTERDRIHNRFIAYFSERTEDTVGYFEIMGHHYGELDLAREALLMRVRALAAARKSQDVFALRRLCEGGIVTVRKLEGDEWQGRKSLIERYFIKQWMNAEWMVTNYGNLVKVVEDHFTRQEREIPLSFFYKYATALERTGNIGACKKVLEEGKSRITDKTSETYYLLVLEEGNVLYNAGRFNESVKLLYTIRPEILAPTARARLFVTYIHNFENLGQEEQCGEYRSKAERLSREFDLFDHFLRVEYSKIRGLLNKGAYSPAQLQIRRGIRLAAKHKVYRSLCSMYFVASALYYEKGDNPRAMRFLDKTIRVAKEIGIPNWVYEYTLRYAFIYQKLGLYGNAIESAESVARAAFSDRSHQQHFFSLVALLELLVRVNSRRADQVLPLVVRASRNVQAQNRMALYHRAIARYYLGKSRLDQALHECEQAQRMFSACGMVDEEAGANLTIAFVLLSQKRFEMAHRVITAVRPTIKRMESAEAQAERLTMDICYSLAVGAGAGEIRRQLDDCEAIRPEINDINISMDVDAALFEALVFLGDVARASLLFDRYYSQVRQIISNLPQRYVDDYARNPQLTTAIARYRNLKKRDPGQH